MFHDMNARFGANLMGPADSPSIRGQSADLVRILGADRIFNVAYDVDKLDPHSLEMIA